MMKNKIFTLCFFALWIEASFGQLRLPHVLSDNMVLQRDAVSNFWGWSHAAASVAIKASWLDDTIKTTADGGGRWSAEVPITKVGGPYKVFIASAGKEITLTNVLLGDVWLCSGQSNMEWGGNQNLKEILEELPQVNDPNIRLLQVGRTAAAYPQEDIVGNWQQLNAESLKPFSAIGYFIAKELRRELDVPIGIINASWGGTPAEVWTPEYLISNDAQLAKAAATQTEAAFRPYEPGVLWNSMIYPLTPFNVSGFFWYQGESNVGSWKSYDKLMRNMVNSWRSAWNDDLPFYFVQIAPFSYGNKVPLAALLREQQDKTARSLSNSAMVVITDLVDNIQDIHPVQKKEVAHRLATIALTEHYKKRSDPDYKSPVYKSHSINGNRITIEFNYVENGLMTKDKAVRDLYIAGADREFHPAEGKIKGNNLIVSSPEVSAPVAVRFGFTETAMPNLFNKGGLPVAPFRTDNWQFKDN